MTHQPVPTAAGAALLLVALWTAAANAQPTLETAEAVLRDTSSERVFDGVVEAVRRATVSAQIAGRVVEIHYDVDDVVPAGAVILRFDDREIRAEVERHEAEMRAATARLEQARGDFSRIDRLYRNRTVSQAEFDRARADRDAAEAALESTRAALAQARERLGYTVVRAPYAGIVTDRHIELGESAMPGTPLMSGFSLERLRVRVDVPQRLVETIRGGDAQVRFGDVGGRTIDAAAVTVFPYADRQSGTIPVRVELPEPVSGVYPGMLVKVAFATGVRQRLVVPVSAVVYRSEVAAVYVVGADGAISFRHVRPGAGADDGSVEILAGLDAGERVAVDPAAALAAMLDTAAGAE